MPPNFSGLKQKLTNTINNTASTIASASGSGTSSSRTYTRTPGHEELREIVDQVIFHAGSDYQKRPMVVVAASGFPDPNEISYDLLLERILVFLDSFVQSDYTIVYLAAGAKHTPTFSWIWKAYRSLNRKYRKNLKNLYIVHPNFFTKTLFRVGTSVISPKFFRKIKYIETLSELATQVPVAQIELPPAVLTENLKHEHRIILPRNPGRVTKMFGVRLEKTMGENGELGLPRVVDDCVQYLLAEGLDELGLFRRSPSLAELRKAELSYDYEKNYNFSDHRDPHIAASLLKKFLRDLPEPIIPDVTMYALAECPPPPFVRIEESKQATEYSDAELKRLNAKTARFLREDFLPMLTPSSQQVLQAVLRLMHAVHQHSDKNQMTASNLSIVLSPNLIYDIPVKTDDVTETYHIVYGTPKPTRTPRVPPSVVVSVIRFCIENYPEVYEGQTGSSVSASTGAGSSASAGGNPVVQV